MKTKQWNGSEVSHWVGIDVSKTYFDVALLTAQGQEQGQELRRFPTDQFPQSETGTQAFYRWLEKQVGKKDAANRTRVVMEATGTYSRDLAERLRALPHPVQSAVINPQPFSHFMESLALRNQTDRLSARALALFGAQRTPSPDLPPSANETELRELVRYRHALVEERTAMSNRDADKPMSSVVRKVREKRRKQIDKDIAAIEQEMRAVVEKSDGIREDIALLLTIYGVGFITAVTVRSELGDLRRFRKARQLSAFAGLSPRESASGTSVRKRTRMSKAGNARVRSVLHMAAIAAVSKPNPWQAYHHRNIHQNNKQRMESIGAIMRKLLVLMRAILISGKPYDPALHAA